SMPLASSGIAAAIELRGVGKLVDTTWAVRGITLSIATAELFTVLGPAGSGKTTLLRLIAGFAEPDLGEIRFDGNPVTGTPPAMRDLGVVPTTLGLWPHRTVVEHVAFGLRERRMPAREIRARVAETLRLVGLEGLEPRRPAQLTDPERWQLALARAIAVRPRALLLDDPLQGLDPWARAALRRDVRRIQRVVGITTVLATSDPVDATALATSMGVLDRGEMTQVGTPAEVYRRPLTRAVAELLGDATVLAGRLESGPGGPIVRVK